MKQKILLSLWTALILLVSLYPFQAKESKQFWEHSDKMVHLVMYFVFSILLVRVLSNRQHFITALTISGLFGIVVEAAQGLMGLGRAFEFSDIMANILGAGLGLTGYYFMKKSTPSRP